MAMTSVEKQNTYHNRERTKDQHQINFVISGDTMRKLKAVTASKGVLPYVAIEQIINEAYEQLQQTDTALPGAAVRIDWRRLGIKPGAIRINLRRLGVKPSHVRRNQRTKTQFDIVYYVDDNERLAGHIMKNSDYSWTAYFHDEPPGDGVTADRMKLACDLLIKSVW